MHFFVCLQDRIQAAKKKESNKDKIVPATANS